MSRRLAALCAALLALLLAVPASAAPMPVSGSAHVQDIGWMPYTDQVIGTTGRALRLEALKLAAPLRVEAHVQDRGWMRPVDMQGGAVAGTTGQSLRLEAVRITMSPYWEGLGLLEYQCHVQDIGWMPWVREGQVCGTTGRSLRMEAIRVRYTPATQPTATPTPEPTTVPTAADTIVVTGDVGVEQAGLGTLDRMAAERAGLSLIVGDLGYTTSARDFCDAVTSRFRSPLLWVQGNHETTISSTPGALRADYAACMPDVAGASGTEGVEQVVDVGRYARVITASPMLGTSYAVGSPGYQRIAAAIDAARRDGREPILAWHEPHYTVGVHGPAGPDSQALAYLARAKAVKLVLTAHDHDYSRILVDGVTHIVIGVGGHKPRELDPAAKHWPLVQAAHPGTKGPGYLRLTVTADSIRGELVGSGGDSFTLARG